MKYHDNKFYFSNSDSELEVQKGSYKITDLCITDGQDPKNKMKVGMEIKMDTEDLSFTFEVGRKDSSKVTNWFNGKISSNQNTFKRKGENLNFAFIGTLSLTFRDNTTKDFKDIVIAEGDGRWWFGGQNCTFADTGRVACNGFVFSHADEKTMDEPVYVAEYFTQWMSKIDDSKSLAALSIPGTHDSGTEKIPPGPAHTQNFSIQRQLNDGIRFFDIRLVIDKDKLELRHGNEIIGYDCNVDFDTVLDWCKNFLSENSTETILMSVKNEYSGEDITGHLDKYFSNNRWSTLFYTEKDLPTLGKVRGKIVLFKRFEKPEKITFGIDWFNHWEKDASFSFQEGGTTYCIEDQYDENNTGEKMTVIKRNMEDAVNGSLENFYLTFTSISPTGPHTPYQYAWGGLSVDPIINPSVIDYLKSNQGRKRWGIVVLDFYNNEEGDIDNRVTEYLINSNF